MIYVVPINVQFLVGIDLRLAMREAMTGMLSLGFLVCYGQIYADEYGNFCRWKDVKAMDKY